MVVVVALDPRAAAAQPQLESFYGEGTGRGKSVTTLVRNIKSSLAFCLNSQQTNSLLNRSQPISPPFHLLLLLLLLVLS